MTFKKIFLLVVCISVIILKASAYSIKKIGIEEGLSNNNVISFTQDNDGFIWIGTKDGLNRFDANSFKVFKASENETNSISSNVLNFIFADKNEDIIWIATEKNGVDAYNYKTNVFTHYQHDNSTENNTSLIENGVTHISCDSKGNLWMATYQGGLDYFDKKTKEFTHYNQSNVKGLGSDYNWTLMVDNDETIYLGHVNEGFSIINLKTKTAVNFRHDPQNPSSLSDNTVTSIFKDSKKNIWIGTRNGLTLFDPDTYKMKAFRNIPGNPSSLSLNFIQSIIETSDNKLWIGTEGGGVNILDLNSFSKESKPKDVNFVHINQSLTPDGLSSPSVQSLFQDSFGNIWIGGLGGGINFIPKKEPFFKKISYLPYINNTNSLFDLTVHGLCVDNEDMVWVANGSGGISIYDKGEKVKQISKINNGINQNTYISIINDHNNNIWIGTAEGIIYQYNSHNKGFKQIKCFENLSNIPVYNFFEDSKQNIWLSTDYGLYICNIITGEYHIYTTENSGLSDNVIRAVSEDAYGNIWVGTLIGGLCVFNSDFQLILNYGNIYNFYAINHIYRDSRDRMLIASQNDLFIFKNFTNDSILRIGKDFGLAETSIRAIIEGNSPDEFWLSTTSGITYININKPTAQNFSVSDNIAMGDYLSGSVTKSSDGTIYFGSQNGITWFNQVLNFTEEQVPDLSITNFFITDSKKNINEFINIPFSDTVELKYYQNSFQINFNVLDYSLSDNVEFIYQMKELDDNWYLINKNKYVTFRNLKPGNYVFNVKSRLHNKAWSDNPATMHVIIKPPLWKRWWAKLTYYFIVALILFYIIRFYKNKLKIETDLQLEKQSRQQEHALNEEKIKFFTNITHELRTPMTLILGPLEDLITDSKLTEIQLKKVNSIHRVANRLLQLINQILEFRKAQNKNRKLRVAKDDFVKYVSEIGLKYKELNQNEEIDFQIQIPDRKIEMFFDPEVITIILDNLISNAIKYTRKGIIKLEINNFIENNVDYTEVVVKDTGYGISPDDMPYIFERYYQAKNAEHPVKGTGIGLALVKNMVELHEAEISVSSQQNIGSTFKVKFITNNSYPDVIHVSTAILQSEQDEQEVSSERMILVVDDNQEIVDYIHDSLVDNYKVLTAENGRIGYDIACENIPDIVISDIMMPVMDGIEMLKKMKQDVRTSHIPVILLTAKGSTLDQSEGYSAGADSYLTKPFSANLLKSRLTNILDARKKLSTVYSTGFKNKKNIFHESANKLDTEFLEKLTSIIESNLEDEEMNISFIASQVNMSHSTLYRKIKALTNLTANEYIRKVRINIGEQLLLTNKYSISEIMYKIGINSSSYFRQCFKEEFGMNPSDYLQNLKNEEK
ncbi:MAG: response regulator [Prolixibacteraceae bacterium]|nr:response regulator [Prolixibacteraceae bacterium]